MNHQLTADQEGFESRNTIAALLSVIAPGLGQIYKGHNEAGFFWLIIGMPAVVFAGILLALATAGIGLLLPLVCWAAVVTDAYMERDLKAHHWFPPEHSVFDD